MRFHQKVLAVLVIGSLAPSVVPWSASGEEAKTKVGSLTVARVDGKPSMNPGRDNKREYKILAQQQPSQPSPDQPVNVPPGPPGDDTLKCKADPQNNPKCGPVKTPTKYR